MTIILATMTFMAATILMICNEYQLAICAYLSTICLLQFKKYEKS